MSETARSQALIQALNKFKNSWTNTYIVIVIRYENGYYFTYIASIQGAGNSFHVLEYSASYPTINIWNVTITLDNATISRRFSDDATLANNLLSTAPYTVTFDEIAPGAAQTKSVSVHRDGYKPIGCVGWSNAGSAECYLYQCSINSSEMLSAFIKSVADSTIPDGTSVIVYVLFVKNS